VKRTSMASVVLGVVGLAAGAATAEETLPAFPGAEGYGAVSVGGRGGRVIKVTNLNAEGPGSLAAACAAKGPRIVVFEVSGVIPVKSRSGLRIKDGNITIAGQTAPGAGITIEGELSTMDFYRKATRIHDLTIRFLRCRTKPGRGEHAISFAGAERFILDHLSVSWGTDENVGVTTDRHFTVQWCAIEESARRHLADGTLGRHNFGMIMGYDKVGNATLHHNLFAHHRRRAPLCGIETLDHRNNVIYNMRTPLCWHPVRMNNARPNQSFKANVVANYIKDGPNFPLDEDSGLASVFWKRPWVALYGRGNYFTWLGRVEEDLGKGPVSAEPWPAPPVATHSAEEAYRLVLAHAGCLPRDAVSKRTIEEVRKRVGSWDRHDPPGGLMEGLAPAAPPKDTDDDGMPDAWEKAHGLNPGDPADANTVVLPGASKDDRHKGYTHIESYINELADRLVAQAIAQAEKR